jgi:tetratricopeptide (TPR) repeat protein
MMGQDPDQILKNQEAAIARNPGYLENYLFKAEFLQSVGKTEEALKILEQVIAADPEALPAEQAKNRLSQKDARDLWKKWTGKERPNQ